MSTAAAPGVDQVDPVALAELLRRRGHVRGNPVALSLFHTDIPDAYSGAQVEPCALVREAMDFGRRSFVDAEHHTCVAGAWQAGFVDPPLEIRTGAYLAKYTPYFNEVSAEIVKTGRNVLPQGTVRAIGAAPLDEVPDGVAIDSLVVMCEPQYAATIAGARTAVDGVPPHGAAGTSLCGELFAVPWHDPNVILTPGDMGGRMFNHAKPSELFVIVPWRYVTSLPTLLGERPDLGMLLESIKPGYTAERDAKRRRRANEHDGEVTEAPSMPWDDEATDLLARAPADIRAFAVPTLEAYAAEHGHDRITLEVMEAQMASVGMRLADVLELAEADPTTDPPSGSAPPPSVAATEDSDVTSDELDPKAPVTASSAVVVDATPEDVWTLLADVARWGDWYPELRSVTGPARLAEAEKFSFSTGPVTIKATLDDVAEPVSLAFTGASRGTTSRYAFRLVPSGTGTRVSAAQTMSGLAVRTMKPMLQKIASSSLPEWLEALRTEAERRASA